MYKIRTITCVACKKTITDRLLPKQKYCSLACYRGTTERKKRSGELRSCGICSVLIHIPESRLRKSKVYFCGVAHQNEWQRRTKQEFTCALCGLIFRASPSRRTRGATIYCPLTCRDADPQKHAQLLAMTVQQQQGHRTKPENIGYAILDKLGVVYQPQHVLAGKFCVDAFIPSYKLVVQFDGDYWHGHPHLFPAPSARQMRRMLLDISQDAYLSKCGYRIMRLWEFDLKKNQTTVVEKISALLNTLTTQNSLT